MKQKIKKAIILINSRGYLGGAQIRYLKLFDKIQSEKRDYYLIINNNLFNTAVNAGLLQNSSNVILVDINSKTIINKGKKNIPIDIPSKKSSMKMKEYFRTLKMYYEYIKRVLIVYKLLSKLGIKYLYGVWEGGILAWPSKFIIGFRFVYSYMDSGFSNIENNILLYRERLPLLHANTVDFLSGNLEKVVSKSLKYKIKNTRVTPCSFIDYKNFFPTYPKENIVVFSARLTPIKNPLLLLNAIEIFNKAGYEMLVNFIILGEGELYYEMESEIEKKEFRNVILQGFVNNTNEYLRKSKVFISIQESNNYPSQSLLEAMACENAIIASDVGETRLLVGEKEGILVKLDAVEISKALVKLFSDTELANELGQNARRRVLSEHTIDKYLDYFYSLEK